MGNKLAVRFLIFLLPLWLFATEIESEENRYAFLEDSHSFEATFPGAVRIGLTSNKWYMQSFLPNATFQLTTSNEVIALPPTVEAYVFVVDPMGKTEYKILDIPGVDYAVEWYLHVKEDVYRFLRFYKVREKSYTLIVEGTDFSIADPFFDSIAIKLK